jgi:hypothetical protein
MRFFSIIRGEATSYSREDEKEKEKELLSAMR